MFKSVKNFQSAAEQQIENLNIKIKEQTQKLNQIKACRADTVERYKSLCDDQISSLLNGELPEKLELEPVYEFRRSPLYQNPPSNA
jgi:hypothetical protein